MGGHLSIFPFMPLTSSLPFIGEAAPARGRLAGGQAVGRAAALGPLAVLCGKLWRHMLAVTKLHLASPFLISLVFQSFRIRTHHHFLLLCFPKLCSGCTFLCWGFFVFLWSQRIWSSHRSSKLAGASLLLLHFILFYLFVCLFIVLKYP